MFIINTRKFILKCKHMYLYLNPNLVVALKQNYCWCDFHASPKTVIAGVAYHVSFFTKREGSIIVLPLLTAAVVSSLPLSASCLIQQWSLSLSILQAAMLTFSF